MQCMMESSIMLFQAAEVAVAAGSVPAENTAAPVWPLLAVLVISLMLAGRSRPGAPDDRR
jgi:hypothetical protein